MPVTLLPQLVVASFGGLAGGLALLVRGFQGYRQATRIGDVGSSRIASIAAGEVRISGVVEPAELLLVSPLQSADCVYYRARVRESDGNSAATVLDEERAVGFVVRDGSAAIRVFPRGAAWDVPARLDARDGMLGDAPAGVMPRMGPPMRAAAPDREALVAQLLGGPGPGSATESPWSGLTGAWEDRGSGGGTARAPAKTVPTTALEDTRTGPPGPLDGRASAPGFALGDLVLMQSAGGLRAYGRKHYVEARIEPGDTVTIIGSALPFSSLDDPDDADAARGSGEALAPGELDPEVAADLAAARATGTLAADAAAAWGNAAIPGFGIGQPIRPPTLDPGVVPAPIATPAQADRFRRQFEIGADTLVIASGTDAPLLISSGAPGQAEARNRGRFFMGLAGALLAIVCALAIAIQLGGIGA